jgi:L-aminopeptidase/D-esterase-like protein
MTRSAVQAGTIVICAAVAAAGSGSESGRAMTTTRGLTAIAGLEVGHHNLEARPTGCTVVLARGGAAAAVDVRGASPGTRETALLDPLNSIQQVHAIVLSGGSAFGLAAADGVMRYLDERGIGYRTRTAHVPIVPAAILYDLGVGDPAVRPGAECGYRAAEAARSDAIEEGSVGAGAGATVGKLAGPERAMRGGLGTALIELPDGLQVAALMAVNAVGDIYDPTTGALVAGVRSADGRRVVGAHALLREPAPDAPGGENTTIGVVATNAALDKAQLGVVARMAHDGLARAVRPAHTPVDGDTIFALSTGSQPNASGLLRIGALAADVTAEAIVRAVRAAEGIPGYPAAGDLKESTP